MLHLRGRTTPLTRLLLSPLLSRLTLTRPWHPCCRRLSCCRWCHIRGSKSSRRMLRKEKNRGRRRQPWKRRSVVDP
uniref:Secreted protein n=1 Tax=Oryza meridionalis TaxID=40149 RepID=A0A0E0F863_9ORYZ